MLGANLRGEMSGGPPKPPRKNRAADEWDLVDAVARTLLHVNGSEELTALGGVLFPAMLGNAVARSDLNKLDELKGFVSTPVIRILYRSIEYYTVYTVQTWVKYIIKVFQIHVPNTSKRNKKNIYIQNIYIRISGGSKS